MSDAHLERARTLARWLDNRFVDPILGLIVPGAGDVASSAAGLYIVWIGIQRGVPAIVIARMLINLAVDAVLGSIPVAGDLFDFAFKANRKNLALVERPGHGVSARSRAADWAVVAGAAVAFAAAIVLPIWLIVKAIQALV